MAFALAGILLGLVGLGVTGLELSRRMHARRIKARRRALGLTAKERVAFERFMSNDRMPPRG